MKVFKSLCLALACLSLASVGFTDSSPNYVQAFNGTGNNHNTTIYTLDYSGDLFNAGNLSTSGNVSSLGTMTFGTFEINGSALISGVAATTTILPTDTFNVLNSTGINVTVTSTPSISTATVVGGSTAWADGTRLVLTTTSTVTVTLQDNGTLSGSRLHLDAASRIVGADKILSLIYIAATNFWYETAYANNN